MQVFISSVIRDFEEYREAAAAAIQSLGYDVVRAEDFGARTDTPQRACLQAAREADLTVVLLGDRYGEPQESGLSPTHEEFREARQHRAVAVFIQRGMHPEPRQAEFIEEAQEWVRGTFSEEFGDADELQSLVTRLLHEYVVRQQTGPPDPQEIYDRARARLPERMGGMYRPGSRLHLVLAAGPRREVVPPARLDDPEFHRRLGQEAVYGASPVLDRREGIREERDGPRLRIEQESGWLEISEDGTISLAMPAQAPDPGPRPSLPALIEEDIREKIDGALQLIASLLDEVDPHHRLSSVVVLAAIQGGQGVGWRTRAEHQTSPNQMQLGTHVQDSVVVPDQPRARPRPALGSERDALADDLVARLRREFRQ